MIATPTHSGDVVHEYVKSLLASLDDLRGRGVTADVHFLPGNCYIALARDQLAADFLASDCTDLVFIDADVGWQADGIARLLRWDREIVGGLYPFKIDHESYPARVLTQADGRPVVDALTGLIECDGLPTGFLRIRRDVIQRMADHYSEARSFADRRANVPDGQHIVELFPTEILHRAWWGEDYRFCHMARALGIRIWCEPRLTLTHVGRRAWRGNYHEFMCRQPGGSHAE